MAGLQKQKPMNVRTSMTPLAQTDTLKELKRDRHSLHWFDDNIGADEADAPFQKEEMPQLRTSNEVQKRQSTVVKSITDVSFYAEIPDEPTGPFEFVESHRFQMLVALVIIVNALIIGLETDIKTPLWFWVEQALLMFFVTEMSLRVMHNGTNFFHPDVRVGNIVDVTIVMSGVMDMWIVPALTETIEFFTETRQSHEQNPILKAMGILRMLRIIRLVRLVKIIQPLYRLAIGVVEAMQGMFWVLVFLSMFLYAISIICTRLIGHGAVLPPPEELVDNEVLEIQQMFHSVFSSMFVLFELMSCWSAMPLQPLFKILPIVKLLFVLFYIFAAWALLAVMTGVVSEKMISVREQINAEEKDSKKKGTSAMDYDALVSKFRKHDEDDNLMMSRDEFELLLGDAESMRVLMQHSNITAQDLSELFEWLDADKDGNISVKEFVEGFRWLNETVTPKTFVKLQEKLSSDLKLIEVRLVNFINERFDKLIQNVRQPLRKINAVTTQVQRLDATCAEMSNLLRERGRSQLTREGLYEAERRLSGRIDALAEAVETLALLQKAGLVTIDQSRIQKQKLVDARMKTRTLSGMSVSVV